MIPKALCDALVITPETVLNIVPSSDGLYLYPVVDVVTATEIESAFVSLLKKLKEPEEKKKKQSKKNEQSRQRLSWQHQNGENKHGNS